MNYLRLLVFYITIGSTYDIDYSAYGGPIASQFFYMMMMVSCTGYTKRRDMLIYPFCDFLLIIIFICNFCYYLGTIVIGLAEGIMHS
jgi:hypothetical protein